MKYLPIASSHDNIIDKVNEIVTFLEYHVKTIGEEANEIPLILDISYLTLEQKYELTMLYTRYTNLNLNKRAQK